MSSGAGQNTVTSNTSPPSQFVNALGSLGQQAQQTAQTPYQPYTGQMVAPMNGEQNLGIANINLAQQEANPYLTAAGNEYAASTTPLLPGIQPYLDQASQYYGQAGNANLSNVVQPGINAAQSLYGTASNNAANLGNYVQPGIGQANSLYQQSAQQINPTQFSAGQVSQYESPYTQQVVNATQAQFNNQNQQQLSGVKGNAISQGAFGGDREAVAEGITAGQQQLAQAPVIAGLMNQGYSQALNEFNTQQQVGVGAQEATQQLQQGAGAGILAGSNQMLNAQQMATQDLQASAAGNLSASQLGLGAAGQNAQLQLAAGQGTAGLGQSVLSANQANAWLSSQAGAGYANLGNQAFNQTLSQGNAELGAGALQQQQQQSELNVPYEQYVQQQAYPFQTESWLSGLEGQLANAAGGTASTSSPGPSPISQIGGLGLTGLAGYGLLSNAGLLGGAAAAGSGTAALASGLGAGGVSGFAGDAAGVIGGGLLLKRGGSVPARAPGGGIVAFPMHRARPRGGVNDNGMPLKKLAVGGTPGGIMGGMPIGGTKVPQIGDDGSTGIAAFHPLHQTGLGGVGGSVHHHADADEAPPYPGGAIGGGTFDKGITPELQNPMLNGGGGPMRRGGGIIARRDSGGPIDDNFEAAENDPAPGGISGSGPFDLTTSLPTPPIPPRRSGIAGYSPRGDSSMPVPPIPPEGGPPPAPSANESTPAAADPAALPDAGHAGAKDTHVPWETLLAAGLSIMGGSSPHALTNIGRGGMQGLEFGEQQRVREENASLRRLQAQQLADYRQSLATNQANKTDIYGQRVGVFQQEADQHGQAIQNTDAYRQAVIANRSRGLDEKTANDQALQQIRQQNANTALYGTFTRGQLGEARLSQGDARLNMQQQQGDARISQGAQRIDQGQARIDQGAQRIAASQEAQQARLALTARGQDSTSANSDVNAASRMVSSGMVSSFAEALQKVQAGRATQQRPAASAAPAGAVADPLGIR